MEVELVYKVKIKIQKTRLQKGGFFFGLPNPSQGGAYEEAVIRRLIQKELTNINDSTPLFGRELGEGPDVSVL
jgi:hypothetical protein